MGEVSISNFSQFKRVLRNVSRPRSGEVYEVSRRVPDAAEEITIYLFLIILLIFLLLFCMI